MHFCYSIAIHKNQYLEIKKGVTGILQHIGFQPIEFDLSIRMYPEMEFADFVSQAHPSQTFRKFIVSPRQNDWTLVYPSTGWFSEVQYFAKELSRELECITMALLVDNPPSWGYELFEAGKLLDQYHSKSSSEVLSEKQDECKFLFDEGFALMYQPQRVRYQGTPMILANKFGLEIDRVTQLLDVSRLIGSPTGKMLTLFHLLGIKNGDRAYEDWVEEAYNSPTQSVSHLVFTRKMTKVELIWLAKHKSMLSDTAPPFNVVPPLWLNDEEIKSSLIQ